MGSGSSIQKNCKNVVVSAKKVVEKKLLPEVKQLKKRCKQPIIPEEKDQTKNGEDKDEDDDDETRHSHIRSSSLRVIQSNLTNEENIQKLEDDVAEFIATLGGDLKLEQEKLKLIRSPSFDVWECKREELVTYIMLMFGDLGITKELQISYTRLKKWLVAVEQNYIKEVFFHNFRHAFCVTQMMYFMIHELKLMKYMTTLQLTVLLVACICHDLDHPGLNNQYQQKAHTELSVLYHDRSPLEHHHCAVAFQLLSANDLNIFANLGEEQFDEVSHIVIQLILATDMSIHDRILDDFQRILADGFSFDEPEHLLALQKILIKCCDISNEVRPLETSKVWVDRLFAEFFAQAERERREGLPVEVFMQKSNVKKANDQLAFIRKIIMPLFDCLGKVFPDVNRRILRSLQESELFYERLSADEIEQIQNSDVTDEHGNGFKMSKFIIPEIIVSGCK